MYDDHLFCKSFYRNFLVIFIFMLLISLWIISLIQLICAWIAIRFRTDKLTDLWYGGTFFIVTWVVYLRGSSGGVVQTLLVLLLSVRSIRLAGYLFLRVLALGKDKRFDGIREQKHAFAKFWLLQTVVIFVLLIPVLRAMEGIGWMSARYTWLGAGAVLAWICLESIADRQKFRFKQQYPTRPCTHGVRAIVQYPNYLGEIIVWIGIYLVCLVNLSGSQVVLWLISPFTISRLLVFVTWIPPLEKAHTAQWWTDKERLIYKKNTPKLLPYIW